MFGNAQIESKRRSQADLHHGITRDPGPSSVRQRTESRCRRTHHVPSTEGDQMTKRQHGNKEAKKPKRAVLPTKPPATVMTTTLDRAVVAPRNKR
jgi:hypothetical protein